MAAEASIIKYASTVKMLNVQKDVHFEVMGGGRVHHNHPHLHASFFP